MKKAKANLRRHRVSFEEAATVFLDPIALTYADPDHSDEEPGEITIGRSGKGYSFFLTRGGASELDSSYGNAYWTFNGRAVAMNGARMFASPPVSHGY